MRKNIESRFPARAMEILKLLHGSDRGLRFAELVARLKLYNQTAAAALAWLTMRELAVRQVIHEAPPRNVQYVITLKGKDLVQAMEPVDDWRRRWG